MNDHINDNMNDLSKPDEIFNNHEQLSNKRVNDAYKKLLKIQEEERTKLIKKFSEPVKERPQTFAEVINKYLIMIK